MSKGKSKLLGPHLPQIELYEANFHKFFDGLIGTETFSSLESILNYKDETITIANQTIKFHKYPIKHGLKEFNILNASKIETISSIKDLLRIDHLSIQETEMLISTIMKYARIIPRVNEKLSAATRIID